MKHLFLILIILLFNSCDDSSVKKQKYKIVYEINYPNLVHRDSLINDRYSEFNVRYVDEIYYICGDNAWALKEDKYPIIIRKIEKL